ncbi:PREDICTED: KH domain-containing protein HEN4 isoform X2 [Ipomoea nil]|uniref:KH domain-containing protein HEN4 isoform X2 n=1 Tax=Ipomoea nil TaxID=35883 RepID=UPI0009019427|nr:PREDICTED: KH domain-containing protein HEN4 isoform X2 [Ipomoea nil]
MSYQSNLRGSFKRGGDPSLVAAQPGQVNFRLLCHISTAGGVIGNNGSIVKSLENQTGCKIRFEEPLPNCHERVINITGDAVVENTISIDHDTEEVYVQVSKAQESLVRVYEKILQVEGNGGEGAGAIGCRLLACSNQIGALMGKGGKIVDAIRKSSGAKIKVSKKEQNPACAGSEEELIQIMGGILAVKKALVPVSRRLQDCTTERTPQYMHSRVGFHENLADFSSHPSPVVPPFQGNAIDHSYNDHSLSAEADRVLSLDEDNGRQKVVFRLLCSNVSAGGVIGRGATIVKALEKETGASIKFSPPVPGSKDRVATISSLENKDPLYSSAQIATVRVFERCMEVGVDQGLIPGLGMGETVTAKILVALDELNCLVDEEGNTGSGILVSTSGVEIQLLQMDLHPSCATENDRVVEIVGEYVNVKNALFQVTGKLRENLFFSLASKGVAHRHYPFSSMPESSLGEIWRNSSAVQTDLVPKPGGPHIWLHNKQVKNTVNDTTNKYGSGGWNNSRGALEHGSLDANGVADITVEIMVPGQKFGSIYGEDGTNLNRLKEISGTKVTLEDPHPGENNGKVIITGTPDRIQIARSLLQAFIRV